MSYNSEITCLAVEKKIFPSPPRVVSIGDKFVAVGMPVSGVVAIFSFAPDGNLRFEGKLAPTNDSAFSANQVGFGHRLALDGNTVIVSAYRIDVNLAAAKQNSLVFPANVATTSSVYAFDLASRAGELIAAGNADRAVGYSVATDSKVHAFSIFEKPAEQSDPPLPLFAAVTGGLGLYFPNSQKTKILPAPPDARGFGFSLTISGDEIAGLAPHGKAPLGLTVDLNTYDYARLPDHVVQGAPMVELVRNGTYTAYSTGSSWSKELSSTIVAHRSGRRTTLPHGGFISGSDDFLAIVEPSIPDANTDYQFYLYQIEQDGELQSRRTEKDILAAAIHENALFTIKRISGEMYEVCLSALGK